ncbi:hypothetical protein LTR08_007237 [Meristemomyces frigidus]|nr:hypothetical protein LTR08_007237 [Meristemomyces frigidus]
MPSIMSLALPLALLLATAAFAAPLPANPLPTIVAPFSPLQTPASHPTFGHKFGPLGLGLPHIVGEPIPVLPSAACLEQQPSSAQTPTHGTNFDGLGGHGLPRPGLHPGPVIPHGAYLVQEQPSSAPAPAAVDDKFVVHVHVSATTAAAEVPATTPAVAEKLPIMGREQPVVPTHLLAEEAELRTRGEDVDISAHTAAAEVPATTPAVAEELPIMGREEAAVLARLLVEESGIRTRGENVDISARTAAAEVPATTPAVGRELSGVVEHELAEAARVADKAGVTKGAAGIAEGVDGQKLSVGFVHELADAAGALDKAGVTKGAAGTVKYVEA